MSSGCAKYRTEAILRDGSSIRIRALRADDKPRVMELFRNLSQRSLYFRLFRTKQQLSDSDLEQFTDLDFIRSVGLAATQQRSGWERILGAGRYSTLPPVPGRPARAEITFAVVDDQQGRGIGTLLLEHLAFVARSNGISRFEAYVLEENDRMLKVFDDSGFEIECAHEDGVIHVSFPIEATARTAQAQLRRERRSVHDSLKAILEPRSVAVIGASRQAGTIGSALISNLRRCRFTGDIYPINPKAGEIEGLAAHPSISAVGKPVDVAVIAVPASMVERAVQDCANAGVRGVVIISSGFGEVAPEGREAEKRLRELVRSSGMRMIGPNCMGVLNTDPAVSLNATFVPSWPPQGNIGVVSQSGALGYVILNHFQSLDIGVSTFVSVGNKADVSAEDLLSYWAEDPATRVIMLYLESFGDPRRFVRIAPDLARVKPIVAIKAGRSGAGERAASSHSAALASPEVAVEALFRQAGVIRVDTLEKFLDVAILLSSQPVPQGPRVGIITNGGGPGILLADACEGHGLTMPELTPQTRESLRSLLPPQANLSNPVDMLPSSTGEQYAAAIRQVGSDPGIDSIIVIYIPPQLHPPEEVARAIALAAGDVPRDKPVLTVVIWPDGPLRELGSGPRGRLPCYGFPENAAFALSMAERYGRWCRRPRGRVLIAEPSARSTIRQVIDRALRDASEPVWLQTPDLAAILRAAGIDYAAAESAFIPEALEAAERVGYPLVLKVQSSQVLHKSDVGGVITGLRSRADVAAGLGTLADRMRQIGVPLERVLLQREVSGGVEVHVGVTADPSFGPLVVCGLGGVLLEVHKDVTFRLAPVSDLDAQDMIAALRSGALLDGYRGAAPADRRALAEVIQRISSLAELVPELLELDLNPVKVLEAGMGAVVVDVRMRIGPIGTCPETTIKTPAHIV